MSLLFPVTFHYFRVFHTILFCSALFYFLFIFIFIFCLVIFIREIGMKADVLSSNLENFLFHIICFYLYLFTQIILLSFLILRHHMNISDNIVCLLACYQCLLFFKLLRFNIFFLFSDSEWQHFIRKFKMKKFVINVL